MNQRSRNLRIFASCILMVMAILAWPSPPTAYAAVYDAVFVSQNPQGLALPYATDEIATFQLQFKNTGTATWNNTRNTADPNSIELRSLNEFSAPVDSPLYPGAGSPPLWVNRQRVVGPESASVAPNATAIFTFAVKMPATPGPYRVFFQPYINGGLVGTVRYFDLDVKTQNVNPPSSLTAIATGLQVTLQWTDNATNEEGFRIERMTGSNSVFTPLATIAANTTSYQDQDVVANTRYTYRIRAYQGGTVSAWSNEYYADPLASPNGLTVQPQSQTEIQLQWIDNSLGETGFKLYRGPAATGPWQEIADLPAQPTHAATFTYTDQNLAFDTPYFYGVLAYANSTELTPHKSAMPTVPARTMALTTDPSWVKTYRLVRAGGRPSGAPVYHQH